MTNKVNWGIIGPGKIAHNFMGAVNLTDNSRVVACASKSLNKAEEFAKQFNIEFAYDDYQKLVENEKVDAVYIGTTHNFHFECVKLCLLNNKHVLCEKPFTINAEQAKELTELAKSKNLFLMEAMWTRFLPAIKWVKSHIDNDVIGDILHINSNFGFKFEFDKTSRIFDKSLGGGGLLDIGIYNISLTSYFLGLDVEKIQTVVKLGETGVDEQASICLLFKNNKTASLNHSVIFSIPQEMTIFGTKGTVTIPRFWCAQEAKVELYNGESFSFCEAYQNGFLFQVNEANSLILNGELESKIIPHEQTIQIMELCDKIRCIWGLEY